jgi:hypothetical protein
MRRKISLALALIGVLVVASIAVVYFTEASVEFSLHAYMYQKTDNQWFTATDYFNQSSPRINGTFTRIECKNSGLFDASFNIIVKLVNATFSQQSFESLEFVDANTIKLSYSLHNQERAYTNVNFTIGNDSGFAISIDFQSNQPFLRQIETNWGEQNEFSYSYLDNNTFAPSLVL